MDSLNSLEGVDFLLEEIRAEHRRIEGRRKEILAETLQLQKEAAELQERCPHGSMIHDSTNWFEPVSYCPDCGLMI